MEVCRLCLLNGADCMDIFSDSALRENVVEIISQHVGEVIESDLLPNHVCMECWTKISDFHAFHSRIRTAQARYLNDLVKYEGETNSFVDVFEPGHLNIEDAYADQQIDVLAAVNDEQNEATIKTEHETFKSIFIETSEQMTLDESMETSESDQFKVSEQTEYSNESDADIEYSARRKQSINKSATHRKEFTCDICSKTFATKQIILRHLMRHVKNVCPFCPKRYLNQYALDCHIKTEHSKDKFEELKKQLEVLKRNKDALERPDSKTIEAILVKHYDAACDICSEHLPPSLEQIKAHYVQEHAINGYLKCCGGIKFKSIDQVNKHVIFHLHPEIHTCAFCDSQFVRGNNMLKSFDSIEKHIEKHLIYGQRLKAHVCVVCRARFASIKLLNVHQKYYHEIDESNSKDSNTAAGHGKHRLADFFTMRCDFCDDVTFSTFQDARQHYQNTHEMRGYLVCCDRKFMKPKSVDDHFQWHINPEYLKCHYCGKCFSKKLVLATHISRHKAIEAKRFSCPKCDKAFESNHCLKKHVIVHDEEMKKTKNVPCPHCQKRYATERSLLCHIRYAHTRDRDGKGVICEICGKTFVSQSTVQTHIRIVHCTKSELDDRKDPSKRQQCTMCDASFINKYRLKKHVDTIHMAEPVKCKLCDKIAPNPPALVCHMKSVHVEQNFQCHLCAKAFKAAAALKDHIATHTGEKLYKCSFCPEAFIWRPNMYSHQKKAHPEEWKSKKSILK